VPNENYSTNSMPTSQRQRVSGTAQAELLQTLLDRMQISKWDLIIVGDGSGTGWNDANAYASVLIDRETRGRKTFWGGNRYGSVTMAEMEAYIKPLIWFDSQYGKAALKQRTPLYVHVITDSQTTAAHGTRAANMSLELPHVSHRPIWAAMREFTRMGYNIKYHWARRQSSDLNIFADMIAGFTRREVLGIDDQDTTIMTKALDVIRSIQFADPQQGRRLNPYGVNPDAGEHDTNNDQ